MKVLTLFLFASLLSLSIKAETINTSAAKVPLINYFTPTEAVPGEEINIIGSGFGTGTDSVVRGLIFSGGDGPDVPPSLWTDSSVRVKVPSSATTGPFTIVYVNESGITQTVTSPGSLRILSGYDRWKKSAGFINDNDRPAADGLCMLDRYFHGITSNPTSPAFRPLTFSATSLLITPGQIRPVLKISRGQQATEIDFWIERSTNLASGAWQNVDADVQVTTNPANTNLEDLTITDFSPNSGSKAFYRLGLSTNTNLLGTSISNLPSIRARNESVSFPKIFQPWEEAKVLAEGRSNRVVGTNAQDQRYFTPRHNLRWEVIWRNPEREESFFSGPSEMTRAELLQKNRGDRKLNPAAIRLAVVEYYEGETNNPSFGPPASSPFWLRTASGSRIRNFDYDGGGTNFSCLLDFSNPEFQDLIADRAAALVAEGLFDGIFLDCWSETRAGESQWFWVAHNDLNGGGGSPSPWGLTNGTPIGSSLSEVERNARLQLLAKIRAKIGTNKIIIANINYGLAGEHALSAANPLLSGTNLDGVYMECAMLEVIANNYLIRDSSNNPIGYGESLDPNPYLDPRVGDTYWRKIEKTMAWVESPGNLRSQGLNCIEIWHRFSKFDPRDLRWMRAGLSLTLVCSDSYYLFSEPNWWRLDPGIGVKRHAWYDDWNKSLGRPVDPKRSPIDNAQKSSNGTYSRAFDQGIVFYNPPDNPQKTLVFAKPVKSVSTGNTATSHAIGAGPDGDIFLLTQPGDPR